MNLKNGYKTLYEVIEGENRVFKASKTSSLGDADTITSIPKGSYKFVYEKAGKIFASSSNIPTESDVELSDFNKCFIEAAGEVSVVDIISDEDVVETTEEPAAVSNEPSGEDVTENLSETDPVEE